MEEGRDYIRPAPVASSSTDVPTEEEEEEDAEAQALADRLLKARNCPFPGLDIRYSATSNGRTDICLGYKFKLVKGNHKAVSELIGYDSKADPTPQESDLFVLQVGKYLRYNNLPYKVTNIDQSTKKATIDPVIAGDGDTVEMDLEVATSLSEKYHRPSSSAAAATAAAEGTA